MDHAHLALIGDRLRAARVSNGFTQRGLSTAVGISQPEIARIENGGGHLTVAKLLRIASVLNVKPASLLP